MPDAPPPTTEPPPTPRPWHLGDHGTVIYNGVAIARVFDRPERAANAALIIEAVNAFEPPVEPVEARKPLPELKLAILVPDLPQIIREAKGDDRVEAQRCAECRHPLSSHYGQDDVFACRECEDRHEDCDGFVAAPPVEGQLEADARASLAEKAAGGVPTPREALVMAPPVEAEDARMCAACGKPLNEWGHFDDEQIPAWVEVEDEEARPPANNAPDANGRYWLSGATAPATKSARGGAQSQSRPQSRQPSVRTPPPRLPKRAGG